MYFHDDDDDDDDDDDGDGDDVMTPAIVPTQLIHTIGMFSDALTC